AFHQNTRPGQPRAGDQYSAQPAPFDPYGFHNGDSRNPGNVPPFARPNGPEQPLPPAPRPGEQPLPLPPVPKEQTGTVPGQPGQPRPENQNCQPCQPCQPGGRNYNNCQPCRPCSGGWYPGKVAGRVLGRVFGGGCGRGRCR
ncbi:MAG: hypothetical protein K2X27_05570, partial [Candidatus Obscuribacterales bacterium]|nr:hypothetical protein [Candidatus Obscuribacterales bacterium]